MIKLETLSGQPYDTIYLNEHDTIYKHILKHIKRPDYPEFNYSTYMTYTMYVKTDIKLFNKGNLINFDDDISFDKEDSILQIFIKYEYICYNKYHKIYNFTVENRYEKILYLIKIDGLFLNLLRKEEQTDDICKLAVKQNGLALDYVKNQTEDICKLAVQQIGGALRYVKEQTEELCKLAVQQHYSALKYVKEQTEELCKLAVQQHPSALCYVPEHMKHLFI